MSSWTAQRVLDAAAAMEFVPEGATEVRTDDYRLLRHADWALGPSLGAAQVTWSRTTRPPGEGSWWLPGTMARGFPTSNSPCATAIRPPRASVSVYRAQNGLWTALRSSPKLALGRLSP